MVDGDINVSQYTIEFTELENPTGLLTRLPDSGAIPADNDVLATFAIPISNLDGKTTARVVAVYKGT